MEYNPRQIEKKWQKIWAKNNYKIWHASDRPKKKSIYILDMFPYPSGEGLHIGHIEGYTASDILSRYYRMKGYEVLHPMGWDAFGLPAENYALKTKKNPKEAVEKNIKNFRNQLQLLGFSYDWQREINTTDPNYYKWTQWIFLQLFKQGLAYEDEAMVNWCPSCRTVLANEEVSEGKCERCESQIERKKLKQWMLKITDYAEELLKGLDALDWPEKIKTMQKNWIGKSEGFEVDFKVEGENEFIKVFTTRIDTIFGASYLVLAPEHPLLEKLRFGNYEREVKNYLQTALRKSDFERQAEVKEKTGVFTGFYALNPASRERIPVWVSDYVLMSYGTGAVMGVPAHDERDFEFAKKFNLRIKEVISFEGKTNNDFSKPYSGEGFLINSGPFNGMPSKEIRKKIALYVGGKKKVYYKLRDWVFSRQRYWGEPIPIIKCGSCGNVPLKESQLPLKLPEIKKYEPSGKNESPLADISSWVNVRCPKCQGPAKRETNTMPQWAGSSWYYLRYLDPKNKKRIFDNKKEKNWLPVDIYIGGAEHAVLHLLYARFWHRFLYDLGIVSTQEPFLKLVNQGIILGENGEKMSKSKGNVVSPEEMVKKYGADSLKMYEMFMGPFSYAKPWSSQGITGIYRFLNRVWNLTRERFSDDKGGKEKRTKLTKEEKIQLKEKLKELEKERNKLIKKVTEDIEHFRFNTAISSLMEYTNKINEVPLEKIPLQSFKTLVLLLAPFAPHLSEELWQLMGQNKAGKKLKSIQLEKWPIYDESLIKDKTFFLVIQVNGKVRAKKSVAFDVSKTEAVNLSLPLVNKYLKKAKPEKIIFVKNRLINFVV